MNQSTTLLAQAMEPNKHARSQILLPPLGSTEAEEPRLPLSDITGEAASSSDFEEPNGDSDSGSDQPVEPTSRGGGKDLERLR